MGRCTKAPTSLLRVQVEGGLVIAINRDFIKIEVPDLARLLAEICDLRFGDQHVPCALHVLGGKGLAIMLFDAFVQLESQLSVGVIP